MFYSPKSRYRPSLTNCSSVSAQLSSQHLKRTLYVEHPILVELRTVIPPAVYLRYICWKANQIWHISNRATVGW